MSLENSTLPLPPKDSLLPQIVVAAALVLAAAGVGVAYEFSSSPSAPTRGAHTTPQTIGGKRGCDQGVVIQTPPCPG